MYHPAPGHDMSHGTYSVCVRDGDTFRLHYQDGVRYRSHRGDLRDLAAYARHAMEGKYPKWRARVACYTRIDLSEVRSCELTHTCYGLL